VGKKRKEGPEVAKNLCEKRWERRQKLKGGNFVLVKERGFSGVRTGVALSRLFVFILWWGKGLQRDRSERGCRVWVIGVVSGVVSLVGCGVVGSVWRLRLGKD